MAAPDGAVSRALTDAIDRLFAGRDTARTIGVALSGGGDSLALLLSALEWAEGRGVAVRAATVDHGLRPEAADEARWVAEFCAARAVPHDILTVTLADGPDLQARARAARYDALGGWARGHGLYPVLIGHTQDDVAETLVMRLRRGVGLDGLARMAAWRMDAHGTVWARPFLDIARDELRAFLAADRIAPVEDPSNADPRFERAEIRQAMATLGWSSAMLARSARHLAEVQQAYGARLAELADSAFRVEAGDLILRHDTLSGLVRDEPDSLRRLIRAALLWIGRRGNTRSGEVARLIDALAPGMSPMTLAGCRISTEKASDGIRFAREVSACGPTVPAGTIWDGRWTLDASAGPDLTIGALGTDIALTPWRETGLPRASLMASPALRRGSDLVAAPVAGLARGHSATIVSTFTETLRLSRPFSN